MLKNENDDELFDVLDEAGHVKGQERRLVVHRSGLLHQAVHVVLEDAETGRRVLLQKRAAGKRIAPLLWDLSCAEHLQPGETMERGARRGLMEELGLAVPEVRLLRETKLFRRTYTFDGETYHDNEFIACYGAAVDSRQPLTIDRNELSETKWVDRAELRRQLREEPHLFTPWFLDEASLV